MAYITIITSSRIELYFHSEEAVLALIKAIDPYSAEIWLYKPWRQKDFIKFEIIVYVS